MALEALYDPNLDLKSLNNSSFMQFQTFDNSLVYTSSRVANFNIDPVPLYINPFTGLKAMTNPSVTDSDPNLNFFKQTPPIFASNQSIPLDQKDQLQKGSAMDLQNSIPIEILDDDPEPQTGSNVNLQNSLPIEIIDDPEPRMVMGPRFDTNEEAILDPNTVLLQSNAHQNQIPGLIQQYMGQDGNLLEASGFAAPMNDFPLQPQNQPMSDLPEVEDCTKRVIQYLYHLRLRPSDNNINYWRELVTEYFAPGAKKRWCVSSYDNALQDKSFNPKDVWQCDACGSRAGKGFELGSDWLPRVTKLVYDNGMTEELLFIDLPETYVLPSGLRLLKYQRAIQETLYANFRVVHEGQLCISFNPDLRIMSWEFCAKHHELLVSRSLVMSQIGEAEQKKQNDINNNTSNGATSQSPQVNRNPVRSVRSRVRHALDFDLVDGYGFSKTYNRCLKVAETLLGMEDIINFCVANNMGPIETTKLLYPGLQNRVQTNHTGPTSHFVNTSTNNDFANMVDERSVTPSNSVMLNHTEPASHFVNASTNNDIANMVYERSETPSNSSMLNRTGPTSHFINTATDNDFANTINERLVTPSNSVVPNHNRNNQVGSIYHFVNTATDSEFAKMINERFVTPWNSVMLNHDATNQQRYGVPRNQSLTNYAENTLLSSRAHNRDKEPHPVERVLHELGMNPLNSGYGAPVINQGSQEQFTRMPLGPGNMSQGGSSHPWAGPGTGFPGPS